MQPEEIRKQIMDSAWLSEAPAIMSSGDVNAVGLRAEATPVGSAGTHDRFAEDQISSHEIPRPEEGEAVQTKKSRPKSIPLALVLALLFGPFGLLYVSLGRAAVMLLVFIVGVSLIPKNGFVVLLLWLVAPILSIILFGVGKRQLPSA
jgi:hypothetical protein